MPSGQDTDGAPRTVTPPKALEPWEILAAANTLVESERVDANGQTITGRSITFDVAFLHCQAWLGASWVYAPGRWGAKSALGAEGTLDGCVPARVVWAHFSALEMFRSTTALDTARGIGLAFRSEETGRAAILSALDDAYPQP